MNYRNVLLVVCDLEESKKFYADVLGLTVEVDFGANVTLTGGVCLQTIRSWQQLIGNQSVRLGGNAAELYFEEENFEAFVQKLQQFDLEYVHEMTEQPWGQRAVRFYDPDRHMIEVAEPMKAVAQRFRAAGMTAEQVAARMDVPVAMVEQW